MRSGLILLMGILLVLSCGNRRLSPEELQHKLDSIKAVEIKEKLQLQGIDLSTSDNPLKLFYDSLNIQSLPLSYSEDFVRFLPGFKEVSPEIISYMNLVDCQHPKAVSLPESLGAKLILLAADESERPDESEGLYSLWLYSLDNDYLPVDKLCLYAVDDLTPEEMFELGEEQFLQYFSISSDYEIHLLDYTKQKYKARLEEVYYIDDARQFVLRSSKEE